MTTTAPLHHRDLHDGSSNNHDSGTYSTASHGVEAPSVTRGARLLAALQGQSELAFGPTVSARNVATQRFSSSYANYRFSGAADGPEVVIEPRLSNQTLIAPPGLSVVADTQHDGPVASVPPVPVLAVGHRELLVPSRSEIVAAWPEAIRACWQGGELRLVVRQPPANGVHRGATTWLALDVERSQDARAWCENVDQLFHPNTAIRTRDYEAIWDVFEASGYFALSAKSTPEFEPRKRLWIQASERLQQAPDVGVQVVHYERGRIDGTMSAVALWERSWFFFQLARPRRRSMASANNLVLFDLYRRSYEYAARDPRTRWHVAYIQRDGSSFTRHVNYGLAARNEGPAASAVQFRAVEVPCRGAGRDVADEVSLASSSEVEQLLEVVARNRPRPYVESLDFVPGRFRLPELSARWARAGLERRREVLVAHRGERAVAAAVLEFAQSGLHLFGLLDCVRTFSIEHDGHLAFGALLEAARQRYAQHGRRAFIYMDEHPGSKGYPAGSTDLGWADLVIISVDMTVDLLDDVLIAATEGQRRLARQFDQVGLTAIDDRVSDP